ncbi:NUDIX hydrolase [Dictyobacter aurantiacus]|uniref:NUDIX hydrolase n=1 Tax=Dictyobacter aurantiacus TaxID=1936993 RepID=A0A401ZNG1_9CHLR|nr:NUDIX hydrolase [Dictyobacter aurantiacus]GCE08399.1 NUDIX hydrolase [Dictyobacter aurantiacus]
MEDRLKPWKVLESTITYEDRWLKVRSDRCQNAHGLIIEPYHVMEYSNWVNVLAVNTDGQVVLVREYRHGAGRILVGLPGGGTEPGDARPVEAMQRELLEETGYGGGQFFEVGHSYANPGNQNNIIWSFLAIDVQQTHEQSLDENEDIEVVLQDLAEFNRQTWQGGYELQAMHLATIGLATQFILTSGLPQLQPLQRKLLQKYDSTP